MPTAAKATKSKSNGAASSGDVREASDDVVAQIATLKTDISQLFDKLGALGAVGAGAAGGSVAEAASGARDKANNARRAAAGFVERRPLAALGVAAGVGLAIGILSRPRK